VTSQVPPERTSLERNYRLVNGIRSSIAQHVADPNRILTTETEPKRAPFDREAFEKSILTAVMVFMLILAVAAAIWIYTSPRLDKVAFASG